MVFRPTLLPVPVAPAMRRWGILARLVTTGTPSISVPRARVSAAFEAVNSLLARILRRLTSSRERLGISMPTAFLPGIGATTRTGAALSAMARSSARETILLILMPGAGVNSYMVITGPGLISRISPSTPKSLSLDRISEAFALSSFSVMVRLFVGGLLSKEIGGI